MSNSGARTQRTIIDTHAHIYPDAVAVRAAASTGEFYGIPMCMDGTLSQLLAHGEAAGVSRFLVHSVAVTPDRVAHVNDYLMHVAAEHGDRLIGFGSLHPDFPDVPGELGRIKAGGLRGVKLHPDIQRFCLDDEKAIAMFQAMADIGLPALVHIGDTRYPYSEPARMARVLDKLPSLKVICAHLGGWSLWTEGWRYLAGRPNVWVDTSSSLYALKPEVAVEIIRRYGPDRVFFGTDYPMWKPEEEMARFMALPLTENERERIFHLNFEQFLAGLL